MNNELSFLTKCKFFAKAFLEYLRRPKTVFDLKDRALWLLLYLAVCGLLYFLYGLVVQTPAN